MATPACTGRLISSNPIEEDFFTKNRNQLDKFYLKIPEIINNPENKGDIRTILESAEKKLADYDISFDKDTECLKPNILAMVSLRFFKDK